MSYQFKTLSLKLAADASNYGVQDSDVLLQKNFIQCHKATPVGLGKLRNVVMHKKKRKAMAHTTAPTGIDPKPMDSSQNR